MNSSPTYLRGAQDAAIARAKREWQCIADALPQLLCLVDKHGQVIRTNLTVERWSIGPVREVLGLDLHNLLHRNCSDDCPLRDALIGAWRSLPESDRSEFELLDEALGMAVKVEMKLMPEETTAARDKSASYAVCIVSDITQLRLAQENQRILNQELETRVRERTQELSTAVRGLRAEVTRRELAESSLRNSRNELSLLSEQLMKAQESERKRIAQDLHDAVGQSLSAIKYSLERAILMLASPHLGNPVNVIGKAVEHVQNTIDEVRTISENLRPALLDGLGAVSAIRWLCREWGEVFSAIQIEINLHVTDADIEEPIGTALFRSVQEALNNVARHSKATRVAISIGKESDQLRVDIADNGMGFDQDNGALRRGRGLSGLRERTANTGGQFSLTSYPGGGTHLSLLWPLHTDVNPGAIVLCAS